MNPTKLTHEEVLVVDKITYEAKITDFELQNTPSGRQYFWDGENSEKMSIKDGLQFICDAACYGFDFALEFGLTQQEIDTWNAMIDRVGLSDEFKAEDFKEREILRVKESTRKQTMKKLNITKEQFEKSKYFKDKYGKLEYVSESGKVFKTNRGKVLMFKEAIMGGGEYDDYEPSDEEPLAEWKVGDRVNIDVWQVQWEYDDDDLADLPKTGWKIVNVERDENYDDCDGYCYTIVNIRNPKLKVEVSSSALVERKSVKKSGRKFKESSSFADESTLDMAEEIFTALRRANKNKWNLGFSQSRAEVTIEDIHTNDCFTIKVVKD